MKEWNYKNIAISKEKHRQLEEVSDRLTTTKKNIVELLIGDLWALVFKKRKGKSSDSR